MIQISEISFVIKWKFIISNSSPFKLYNIIESFPKVMICFFELLKFGLLLFVINWISFIYVFFINYKTDYLSISINNNCFKLNFIESLQDEVKCFSYLKNINVLILSFAHNIKIFEINSLRLVNIQTIDNYSKFLNFNKNIFIAYDKEYISIYKKIDGIKNYQLLSKLYLINYKAILWLFGIHFDIINLLKLDNTNIFAYTNNYSYLINVKKWK